MHKQKKNKSQYIGHFITATESRQSIVNGIIDYFASNEISFDNAAAVGRDWTALKNS